jgi:hypothetical protein
MTHTLSDDLEKSFPTDSDGILALVRKQKPGSICQHVDSSMATVARKRR